MDILKHRLDTGNNPHIMSQLTMIDEQVEEMIRHDIIEPAASPCMVLECGLMVRKKDGAMRFCIDCRKTMC